MNTRKAMTGVPSGPGTLHKCATRCRPVLIGLVVALTLLLPLSAQAAGVSVGTKGIVLSWHTISLTEGATNAAEVMVRLGTQPTGTVTVALSGSADSNGTGVTCANTHDLCVDSPPGGTKSNTSLTFTTTTWETPQTIALFGQDDSDKTNESITVTLTPSGGGYGSTEAATIAVTIRDDDKNQFAFTGLTNNAIEVDEGTSTSTFTVALSANPASTVTVALTSSNAAVSVSPTSLTFTSTTGTTAQTVTITAGSDPDTDDNEYYLRLVPSGSTDTRTRGYSIAVTVDDADSTNDLTVSETALSLNESGSGNTDTFTVVLASAPAAGKDVTVAIGVHGANGKRIATADKNKLTFTSSTYNTAQTVTITGVADNDDSNDTGTVRVTASQDGPFAGLSEEITLTVTDTNSREALAISPTSLRIAEGSSAKLSVTLAKRPTGDVRVRVLRNETADGLSVSPAVLVFTSGTYATAQSFTLHAERDADTDDETFGVNLKATGGGYDHESPNLRVVTIDTGSGNLLVMDPPVLLTVPEGKSATATVKLSEAPTGNVTVSVALGTQPTHSLAVSPSSLTFTASDYANPKTLTFSSTADADAVDERAVATLTASGGGYTGKSRRFEVVSQDDELYPHEQPPTATFTAVDAAEGEIQPNGAIFVSFSKSVGDCSLKTAAVCPSTVTEFDGSGNIAELFSLVRLGTPGDSEQRDIPFIVQVSGTEIIIVPEQPLTATVYEDEPERVVLMLSDNYWSVDGGVQGATVLKTFTVGGRSGSNSPPPDSPSDGNGSSDEPPVPVQPIVVQIPPPSLSVADASVTEGAGAQLAFTVSLDRAVLASDGIVSVAYATRDVTATAGADYTAKSGTLTFDLDEQTKTVNVTVLDDAHSDGGETLELVLSNATGATIVDGTGTGTIKNAATMPRAWSARFGRTAGTHITDAVSARLRDTGDTESHLTVAGWRMPLGSREKQADATGQASGTRQASASATDSDQGTRLLTGLAGLLGLNGQTGRNQQTGPVGRTLNGTPWLNGSPQQQNPGQAFQLPDLRQALVGSAFRLNLNQNADGSAPRLTAWGRVAHTQFDGQEGRLALDGDVTTGTLGVDTQGDRWLAGIAVSHSRGDGGYTIPDQANPGDLETTLTSLHPYLRYALTDRLTVWGLVGYGWGDLTLTQTDGTAVDTDTDFLMGAVGSRGLLLDPATTGGLQVATRLDAMFTRTSTEAVATADMAAADMAATDADAHRLRLVLEGSRRYAWAEGRHLTPTVEVGVRHDWGDAETGFGVEVGGRVQYADPTLGLTVEGAVRGLVAHEAEAYDEWGASGTVRLAPGVGGQGLALTLQPAWGAATASGVEALWGRQSTAGLTPRANQAATGSLAAEVGYGITAFDTGLVTPYAGTMLAEGAGRTYRVGMRLVLPGQDATGLTMTLEGLRQEPTGLQPLNQGLRLQASWGF